MAAAAAPSGGTGNNTAATTTTSRFAAACGALSQYVKAAEAERTRARPSAVRPLPLMPGADVDQEEEPETAAAQLTIVYGGRALVLDDVTADKAADLLRLAAAAARAAGRHGAAAALLGGRRPTRGQEGVVAAVHGEAQGQGRRPRGAVPPAR
ncbi:unnamed protein product [Miscanthus lutarioriparius]|uniref:Protein TIFY n=1 Tax=Miscanthus lutarioriparius TaxID=422564 RepID=A0A811MZE8_9POAL|nr:unnamed protein product [Miscanthus lutarioriparius]